MRRYPAIRARRGALAEFMARAIAFSGDDCLLWPYNISNRGYPQITINRDVFTVHRLVCKAAHGEPPQDDLHAAHRCNNRRCVNPRHLYWATRGQNEQDKSKCPIRAAASGRKLSPQKVIDARSRHRSGHSILSIAKSLGVHHKTAENAILGKTWSWVLSDGSAETQPDSGSLRSLPASAEYTQGAA